MKTIAIVLSAAAAVAVLHAPHAAAQFAKVEDAIKYRKASFTVVGNHMGRLSAMVKGDKPFDAAAAQNSARIIESVGRLPWEAFVPNSATGDTRLKPEGLSNAADFKVAADKMQGETTKLVAAAGSLDTLRTQLGAVGASCKGCHDKFRKD